MPGLTGKTISSTYKALLKTNDDDNGIGTGSVKTITDGLGNDSVLKIAPNLFELRPVDGDSTGLATIRALDDSILLRVDSNNSVVKVNAGQEIANTQYAYFGVNYGAFSHPSADTHYTIPFTLGTGGPSGGNIVDFGTGTDPDTTFTTADTDSQYAAQLVPMMWYVQDNIAIDAVTSIEGADNASGETTRMHLMHFTFNSGSTSALASGTLLAANSDVTNAGNEQAYKSTWSLESSTDVDAGKVILAFFRSDSTANSDYSLNITVKYHLR